MSEQVSNTSFFKSRPFTYTFNNQEMELTVKEQWACALTSFVVGLLTLGVGGVFCLFGLAKWRRDAHIEQLTKEQTPLQRLGNNPVDASYNRITSANSLGSLSPPSSSSTSSSSSSSSTSSSSTKTDSSEEAHAAQCEISENDDTKIDQEASSKCNSSQSEIRQNESNDEGSSHETNSSEGSNLPQLEVSDSVQGTSSEANSLVRSTMKQQDAIVHGDINDHMFSHGNLFSTRFIEQNGDDAASAESRDVGSEAGSESDSIETRERKGNTSDSIGQEFELEDGIATEAGSDSILSESVNEIHGSSSMSSSESDTVPIHEALVVH